MSGLKLKLRDRDNYQDENSHETTQSHSSHDENVLDFKNRAESRDRSHFDYRKKDQVKKKSNKFFYKVSNHHELFKIGSSFYSDYLSGVKSFAISSTGYQTSQQKSILGLASFFDHKEDIKIAIISDNLINGAFKSIIATSKTFQIDLFGLDDNINVHSFYDHFDFINMDELLDLANDDSISSYDEVFSHVLDMYDVVFWDVPDLHKIQQDSSRYFPVIMNFESISIVVAQTLSKKSDIEDIKKFFLGYGLNLKGLLMEQNIADNNNEHSIKKEAKKTSWWSRLFK